MNNKDEELLNGIIDVPNNNSNQNNLEYNFNFETQVNQMPSGTTKESEPYVVPQPSFVENTQTQNMSTVEPTIQTTVPSDSITPEIKQPNEELLNNLNSATNNLVNPNLGINPLINQGEQPEILNIEEPKVNYQEITDKKNYMFMFIVFAIIILFIIFLPQIASLIGI